MEAVASVPWTSLASFLALGWAASSSLRARATARAREPTRPLSKKERKRMEMDPALYKEKMQEKRRRQHEAKKKRAEERWAAATPEEREKMIHYAREAAIRGRLEELQIKARLEEAAGKDCHVVVECGLDEEEDMKAKRSTALQLVRMYGFNRRSAFPVHLHATSTGEEVRRRVEAMSRGIWPAFSIHDASVKDLFDRSKIVLLSPDSPNVLETVEDDKVYVIGGIVDRSVRKHITLEYAATLGVQHARLPIAEAMPDLRMNANVVLNIDHAAYSLILFRELRDWAEVFRRVLPRRTLYAWSDVVRKQTVSKKARRERSRAKFADSHGGEGGADGLDLSVVDGNPPRASRSSREGAGEGRDTDDLESDESGEDGAVGEDDGEDLGDGEFEGEDEA